MLAIHHPRRLIHLALASLLALPLHTGAESASSYVSIPPLINTSSSGDKPNVLFILDNSNSMDEAPSGQAVGSASDGSKSEIARNAIKTIIDNFSGTSRMGLMAYKQSSIAKRRLHDSQYDASFNPANYDPTFTGDRASTTKRYRVPNPTYAGRYIYYNVALPFYASSNYGTKFCYSSTANFDNGSENPSSGPWDTYACYNQKTNTQDNNTGFSSFWTNSSFSPTDSDYAQNILDFGRNLTWQYVSETWYANSSPGKGFLHVPIGDVNASQLTALRNKLARSQFSTTTDTPLRNAGLTPIEGTLQSARSYFMGSLPGSESATGSTPVAPPSNTCAQQDYVILVTDGLPSTAANGSLLTDPATAISRAATEAANLLAQGVRTYVIGFGLPTGVDATLLDTIAQAGGTGATYLANDSETLINSLQSIFLSFANRDTSTSSSAVLANNSRGEGAVFQAVYSPRKEDRLGNEVNWVGSLYGLFIDDQGLLREDSNRNQTLDGYNVDRVVEYFFNSSLGVAQANLYVGADATTAPTPGVSAVVATVDIDELATLWEARDQLGAITDTGTQRDYSTPADQGRYIISSVDGSTSLDFVQVSDAAIDALVDAQNSAAAALTEAQSILHVAQAQYDGAQQAVNDMADQLALAEAARDTAQDDVDRLTQELADANSTLANAQNSLTSAQNDFNGDAQDYTDGYDSRRDAMTESTDNYQNALNDYLSRSADTAFEDLVNFLVSSEGADPTDADAVNARNALTDAQTDAANALTGLNAALGNLRTAGDQAEQDQRDRLQNLAGSGNISPADRQASLDTINALIGGPLATFQNADSATSQGTVATRRDDLLNALIATGVNVNRGPVRDAIDTYNTARQAEIDAETALHNTALADVSGDHDAFFAEQFDLLQRYDALATAQEGVDNAQQNVANATDALAAANATLNERLADVDAAEADVEGAQELLEPVEDSYNEALAAFNSAQAAYDQATATVNDSNTLLRYLDVNNVEQAYNIVRFVRGEDGLSGMRSRRLDYDGDNVAEVWRLGDIVHSSPALVGTPNAGYDVLHRDSTYAAFREHYKHRRQVIYVGANDGMLHAFNAGFWDQSNSSFSTSNAFTGGASATAHPLGAELWAYVPRAALPHLQWLTDPNYAHSYYVDGSPLTFDANVFTPDATHPHGWGTLLIIGMRFGGGPIQVDADGNGSDDTTLRSSYLLFDVTDPEQPPALLAEISHSSLGFTTSMPALVKRRAPGSSFETPSLNEWYVAFGSGPTSLADASSTQNAGIYLYDLRARAFVSGMNPRLLSPNSFIGDITSFDSGNDYIDDTLYYGVNGGSPASATGRLNRTRLESGYPTNTVINVSRTVVSAPTVNHDHFGRRWINFGTGRLFKAPDNVTTQSQFFYGVMEPHDGSGAPNWATLGTTNLVDSTDIQVLDNGEISRNGSPVQIPSGTDVDTYDQLLNAVREHRDGWVRAFDADGTSPSERNLSRASLGGNVLFFSAYTPSTNTCSPEGTSRLFGIDFRTGTALPFEVFAVDDDPGTAEGDVAETYITLGQGLAAAPIVLNNANGTTVFTSKSTTEQLNTEVRTNAARTGRQSWRQIKLD